MSWARVKGSLVNMVEPAMFDTVDDEGKDTRTKNEEENIHLPITLKLSLVACVPLIFLIGLNISALTKSTYHYNDSVIAKGGVAETIALSNFMNKMQIERGMTAVFLSTNRSDYNIYERLLKARRNTEVEVSNLNEIPSIELNNVTVDSIPTIIGILKDHRSNADVQEPTMTFEENIGFYTDINSQLLKATTRKMKISENDRWLIAFNFLLTVGDIAGIQRALGASFFSNCYFPEEQRSWFVELNVKQETYLDLVFDFHAKSKTTYDSYMTGLEATILEVERVKHSISKGKNKECQKLSKSERSEKRSYYFGNMTIYIDKLSMLMAQLAADISRNYEQESSDALNEMAVYICILIFSLVCALGTILFLYNVISKIYRGSSTLKDRVIGLMNQKKKTDIILKDIPTAVVERITMQVPLTPFYYDSVTILASDIAGFSEMTMNLSSEQVLHFLNELYSLLDERVTNYDAYKVATDKATYVVASGLPIRNGDVHTSIIANMALDLVDKVNHYAFTLEETIQMRIGIHTGPVTAGIIGQRMPRYCFLGDTIDTAIKMEHASEAGRIHVSDEACKLLKRSGRYLLEERTEGSLERNSYWLVGKKDKK